MFDSDIVEKISFSSVEKEELRQAEEILEAAGLSKDQRSRVGAAWCKYLFLDKYNSKSEDEEKTID